MTTQRIDVVVLTKNSAKTVAQSLDAIKRSMDIARLIVLDDSNDRGKTLRIASGWTDHVYVYPGNIGEKRDHAIDLVDTPVFAFVDSDVIVNRGAFLRSMAILQSDELIAAVYSKVKPSDPRDFTGGEKKENLTFGFAVLRTKALKQSRIPHQPRGEDPSTGKRLQRLGYKVAWQDEYVCTHLRTLMDTWGHYFQYGKRGHFEGRPTHVIRNIVRHHSMKMLVLQLCFLAGYTEYSIQKLRVPISNRKHRN
ncbi:MAG TPA: glycosyltransferase family A protein [Nitrososphaerales archaeon]|nr:glycosyltransferase family A protein [Nitrososphaerales archaeon]